MISLSNIKSSIIAKLNNLPWGMLFFIFIIIFIGIIMMYSAAGGSFEPWAYRQIIHLLVAIPLMISICMVNLRSWFRFSYAFYFLTLMLLFAVEIFGHRAMGATRWISLGFIKIQPSEIMKIAVVFALARYFHGTPQRQILTTTRLIIPILIVFLPCLLILKQPDLGTAVIIMLIGGVMFFAAGVQIWKFLVVILGMIAALPVLWHFLHNYQKNRVLTFLNPERDPLGAGYNIIQSKIAIGSGGFWGKGLTNGSQSQLNFLPEHQTDFIFTMMSEELGFIGSSIVLLLYVIVVMQGLVIASNCRNHFGRMLTIGIIAMFFLHIFINMSMVMGLLPVVGVPLPLLSYGGTIMITILAGFSFIFNVNIHRNISITQSTKEIL